MDLLSDTQLVRGTTADPHAHGAVVRIGHDHLVANLLPDVAGPSPVENRTLVSAVARLSPVQGCVDVSDVRRSAGSSVIMTHTLPRAPLFLLGVPR